MRDKPLARSTVIQKIKRANYGNLWITEKLEAGGAQDFYAVHVRVFYKDEKIRLLLSDGSTVEIMLAQVLRVNTERLP